MPINHLRIELDRTPQANYGHLDGPRIKVSVPLYRQSWQFYMKNCKMWLKTISLNITMSFIQIHYIWYWCVSNFSATHRQMSRMTNQGYYTLLCTSISRRREPDSCCVSYLARLYMIHKYIHMFVLCIHMHMHTKCYPHRHIPSISRWKGDSRTSSIFLCQWSMSLSVKLSRVSMTHFSCDDYENVCTWSYYNHQIESMNR